MDLPDETARREGKLEAYAQIIRALVLRDMRTRFGGSHWGYAVLVMWPVTHILVMVGIMWFRGVPSQMNIEPVLFVSTGCVPAFTFQYISREVMKALQQNKPLLYYPQVKTFDVVVARLIVEIVKGFTGLIIIVFLLISVGVNPSPEDPLLAITGYCAAILLGIGIGAVNIGIVSFFPGWTYGYIVVTISVYLTSGAFYLPHLMPEHFYEIMKWNPMVDIVEWIRLAYDPALAVDINYTYVLLWGMASLAIGLAMERTVVRRLT